jgi:sirohydrochlorin cobaltochelatase
VPTKQIGIIILAHGSKLRDEKSRLVVEGVQSTLHKIAEEIKKRNNWSLVEQAYFQFIKPNLSESIENLANKGCTKIVVLPFFLFSGNHVTRDIPRILKEEEKKYKDIEFVLTKSLGEDSRIIDIVIDSIKEKVES